MSDCVQWSGKRMANGYGRVGVTLAHRHVYEETLGEIPAGMTIHHRCENRLCVNPEHMEVVSRQEHAGGLGHGTLTRPDAESVKAYLRAGYRGMDVAQAFGISRQQVTNIKKGRCWA